jgi:hypothetical protein
VFSYGLSFVRLSVDSADGDDLDRRVELLAAGRTGLDGPDDVPPSDDAAESGESLAVGVPLAAEVELGLVVDANEKARGGRSGVARAMEIAPSRCLSPVSDVVSWAMAGNSLSSGSWPPWMTSMRTASFGWLAGVTVRWKVEPS